MTTSVSNERAAEALAPNEGRNQPEQIATQPRPARVEASAPEHTLASSFVFLVLCMAMALSTLAFGTVHAWALAFFQAGAALVLVLWAADAWQSKQLRLSRNSLQWPLLGLFALGLAQMLIPASGGVSSSGGALPSNAAQTLSLDPYATRFALVQLASLIVYFAATLAFTDSPRRLRLLTHAIVGFGLLLAVLGLVQFFSSPTIIYWVRDVTYYSVPFGPFINRDHFAGYMEMPLALTLGLLFSGAIALERRLLYIFAAALMGISMMMTASRGGLVALCALLFLLVLLSGAKPQSEQDAAEEPGRRGRGVAKRTGLGLALLLALFTGVLFYGGEYAVDRFVGTVSSNDPTTGRTHFWNVTLDMIRAHPVLGTGLGAYGVAYTRFDTGSGAMRVEQAHNDYLEVLADAGIVGAALAVIFAVLLIRMWVKRRKSEDVFRRGVATGAFAGCCAVLVHSFFDFTLHLAAIGLLFLIMAALATLNGRVEHVSRHHHRGRRRHRRSATQQSPRRVAESSAPTEVDAALASPSRT